MKLPNAERAVIDESKLRDYCLSTGHPRGKHKARIFKRVLGMTTQHSNLLRDALLAAAMNQEATLGELDAYGQRYVLDFDLSGPTGTGRVRSIWIVLSREDYPRLTSCYVL